MGNNLAVGGPRWEEWKRWQPKFQTYPTPDVSAETFDPISELREEVRFLREKVNELEAEVKKLKSNDEKVVTISL